MNIILKNKFPFIHLLSDNKAFDYYFEEASDEYRQLSKMKEDEICRYIRDKRQENEIASAILAEYVLNVRLTTLQTKATIRSTILSALMGVIGIIIGAYISC